MPNWCRTDYTFYADTEKGRQQLIDFAKRVNQAITHPKPLPIKQGFGDAWLGNVLMEFCQSYLTFGKDSVDCTYNNEDIDFRGRIDFVSYSEVDRSISELESFTVATETAWVPMPEMWDMIFSVCNYTDIKYVFLAEESGNEVYINTDTEGRYYDEYGVIDGELPAVGLVDGSQYFSSAQEMLDEMNRIIENLHDLYAIHPENYNLPDDFDLGSLVAQTTIDAAGDLIEDNLYSLKDNEYCDLFFTYAVYSPTWKD